MVISNLYHTLFINLMTIFCSSMFMNFIDLIPTQRSLLLAYVMSPASFLYNTSGSFFQVCFHLIENIPNCELHPVPSSKGDLKSRRREKREKKLNAKHNDVIS